MRSTYAGASSTMYASMPRAETVRTATALRMTKHTRATHSVREDSKSYVCKNEVLCHKIEQLKHLLGALLRG